MPKFKNKKYDKFKLSCDLIDLIELYEKKYNEKILSISFNKEKIIDDCMSISEVSFVFE